MIRKSKRYSKPKRPFDKQRIEEENILIEKYGLKNKKEIWKADAFIGRLRNLAKELITAKDEDKNDFIKRLQKKGFKVENIAEVLGLNKEDWLKRRLQTILVEKKIVSTSKQARQLITHRHVSINNQIVNIPSYLVKLDEENKIKLNLVLKQKPEKQTVEKIIKEVREDNESLEPKKELVMEIKNE